MGRAAATCQAMLQKGNHYAAEVYATAADGTLRCDMMAGGSVGPDFDRLEFRGTGRRLAAVKRPQAGSVREPARPELAGDTPWNLTSSSTTFQLEENP
jgi:hypothetical protein